MAAHLCMKRMARERAALEKPNDDYFVWFENDNLRKFEAYVMGPADTLYEHKFVKLRFEIPDRYPLVPPKCTFIQHAGRRIHPNLYVEGKVCLSILGTWQGEPWALAMTIETVLITVRSLLDNKPYTHEPGARDNAAFNDFVQYNTWRWLLLDYLKHERNADARVFLQRRILLNSDKIIDDLSKQADRNKDMKSVSSPYSDRSGLIVPNYPLLLNDVRQLISHCQAEQELRQNTTTELADAVPEVEAVSKHSDHMVDHANENESVSNGSIYPAQTQNALPPRSTTTSTSGSGQVSSFQPHTFTTTMPSSLSTLPHINPLVGQGSGTQIGSMITTAKTSLSVELDVSISGKADVTSAENLSPSTTARVAKTSHEVIDLT